MSQHNLDNIYNIKIHNIIKLSDEVNNAIVYIEELTCSTFVNIDVIYVLHLIFQDLIIIKVTIVVKKT